MHVQVLHHGRKWHRVNNHMDARHCPKCGATVHGNHGQREHQKWHLDLQEVLDRLFAQPAAEDPPAPAWTAIVSDDDDEEALEGAR